MSSVVFGQSQKSRGKPAGKAGNSAPSKGKVMENDHYQRAANYAYNLWNSRMLKCGEDTWYTVENNKVVEINETVPPIHYESLKQGLSRACLLYTSPSPRDRTRSRMPSSA